MKAQSINRTKTPKEPLQSINTKTRLKNLP